MQPLRPSDAAEAAQKDQVRGRVHSECDENYGGKQEQEDSYREERRLVLSAVQQFEFRVQNGVQPVQFAEDVFELYL